ncbi:glycoside hydrolase [Rhizoclosmatium globosum]|uniref:Glycoside hydrolase n=1 Tax=Rhizoclosmatium globosum TaxID=329046 RepID=A0A1Y2CTM2_9FUNG|nr:glycoside hydrolase [Rhizoclosmatium globosum]|eukprot:ORY50408.1 glycoside hydrolase [Rhizoclosmatium globosum]
MLAFWLDNGGPWDVLRGWTQLDPDTRQSYLDAYHKAGKIVLVSAFGATEWPTRDGIDPITSANRIADFVIQFGLDGVDVDYEDSDAFNAGTAEQWLITYTKTLRLRLPASRYTISHAPQAPYFFPNSYPGGGYLAVHKAVGGMIDFYNVQFYNQGSLSYDTCQSLFYDAQGSSVFEIARNGVPLNKIVVGKPITHQGAVNSGYMDPWKLAACIPDAKAKGWSGGVMGWQYSLDPSFQWISAVSSQL